MWRITAAVARLLALAGCASTGTDRDAPTSQAPPDPASAVQAVAAALTFASQSDPEVGLVNGYASVPPAVQRGRQPIPLASGQANPCAQPPPQRFSAQSELPSGPPSTAARSASSRIRPVGSVNGRQGRCC
jgi:hypothetical protein